MREYASITLNTIGCAGTYMNKQSAEYAGILNVSDAVHSVRSLYKLLNSYRDRCDSDHHQTFEMDRFTKTIMPEWVRTRNFSGQGGGGRRFLELGHFNKNFVKNTRKRDPAGNRVYFPRYC